MDPRIEALKSTAFFGRRFTRRQIADIAETVAMLPNDSRSELSKTICEHLNWTTPKGEYRVSACLRVLERLEECGILTLPAPRGTAAKPPPRPIVHVRASNPQPEIACGLAALEPLALEEAASPEDTALWKALVDRYHYLGCPRPPPAPCGVEQPYVDAPLSATGNFRNTGSLQSGAVVCPASQMRRCRPRARMVFADRIQIAFAGSKPCGCSWFFRPRLSDSCPCAVLRSRRTVRGPPDHAPEGAAAVPNSLLPQFPLSLQAAVKTPRQPGKCRSARKAPR